MPVRPTLRPLLAVDTMLKQRQVARDELLTVPQRRAQSATGPLQMSNVTQRTSSPVQARDHRVRVLGGEISVRVYRPLEAPGLGRQRLPVHLFFHGGSFWLGSVAEYEPLCRWYAAAVNCTVVSVEYRLAPEFPYPTGVEDCYAALCWVANRTEELEVDPHRLSVGGVSAGGNLAAVVSLMARDRSGPSILMQVLEIPATDLTLSQPSIDEFATGYSLTKASLVEAYGFYLPDPQAAGEGYASPLLSADLSALPPAYVQTCACDPLRDEGEAYVRRLREAGGLAVGYRVPGHVHGSVYLTRFLPSSRKAVARTCVALATAYATQRGRH